MINKKLAIIGAGNMGQTIAVSLMTKKVIIPQNLFLSTPHSEKLKTFKQAGCIVSSSNKQTSSSVDIILLTVKPQKMKEVLTEIAPVTTEKQLIISIAAGVTFESLAVFFPKSQGLVRVMPLLTAQISQSVSCWLANKNVTAENKTVVKQLLAAFGTEIEVESEDKIDAFTAVAGIPAYLFYLAEVLESSTISLGFSAKEAKKMVPQILYGSALFLKNSEDDPETLRTKVTSKGGTTEAAFSVFAKNNVSEAITKGLRASYKRAKELRTI